MAFLRILAALSIAVFLTACAQQDEPQTPPVIQGDLIFDKFGGPVGCTEGVYVPGAPPEWQCRPPEDQCEPNSTLTAFDPNCIPPDTPCQGNPFLSANDPQCPPFRDPGDNDDRQPTTPGAGPNNPNNPNNPTRGP